jgi:predicted nuclease of predicted toxin-antitoxin system
MAGRLPLDENLSPRLASELSGQFPGSLLVRSLLRGAPPKVIWLVVGNTSTAEILRILTAHTTAIEAFMNEPITSLLTLRKS